MEPTPALALGHGVASEESGEKRDANQQVEYERGEVDLQREGACGSDVNHLIEGGQQKPGQQQDLCANAPAQS